MPRIAISGSSAPAEAIPVRVQTIWMPRPGLRLPSAPVPERAVFYAPDTRIVPVTSISVS